MSSAGRTAADDKSRRDDAVCDGSSLRHGSRILILSCMHWLGEERVFTGRITAQLPDVRVGLHLKSIYLLIPDFLLRKGGSRRAELIRQMANVHSDRPGVRGAKPRCPVKLAGIQVGRVAAIRLEASTIQSRCCWP
jgi:hypothetical protein